MKNSSLFDTHGLATPYNGNNDQVEHNLFVRGWSKAHRRHEGHLTLKPCIAHNSLKLKMAAFSQDRV